MNFYAAWSRKNKINWDFTEKLYSSHIMLLFEIIFKIKLPSKREDNNYFKR